MGMPRPEGGSGKGKRKGGHAVDVAPSLEGDERTVQSVSCLDQFLCMAFAQLTYRERPRDIGACLRAKCSKTTGSSFNRGQRVSIAGQEPTAGRLLTVYRDSMTGELRRFPAGARGHRQRVPAPRVGNFADDHDLFQLAAATDPNLLVGGREVGGRPIAAERRLARIKEYDIVRHQGEQTDQIAGIDGIDPN